MRLLAGMLLLLATTLDVLPAPVVFAARAPQAVAACRCGARCACARCGVHRPSRAFAGTCRIDCAGCPSPRAGAPAPATRSFDAPEGPRLRVAWSVSTVAVREFAHATPEVRRVPDPPPRGLAKA